MFDEVNKNDGTKSVEGRGVEGNIEQAGVAVQQSLKD
jgi:hypothetical protein